MQKAKLFVLLIMTQFASTADCVAAENNCPLADSGSVPFNNKEGKRVTCGNVVRKLEKNGIELQYTDVFDILEEITAGITDDLCS